MFCAKCGKEIAAGGEFCRFCGEKIESCAGTVAAMPRSEGLKMSKNLRAQCTPLSAAWQEQKFGVDNAPKYPKTGAFPNVPSNNRNAYPKMQSVAAKDSKHIFEPKKMRRTITIICICCAIAAVLLLTTVLLLGNGKDESGYFLEDYLEQSGDYIDQMVNETYSGIGGKSELIFECRDYTMTIYLTYSGQGFYDPSLPEKYMELNKGTAELVDQEGCYKYFYSYKDVLPWLRSQH